jgi:predicted DNA binding protein
MWTTKNVTPYDHPGQRAKIISLVKKSGDLVVFSGADPGRVLGDVITGTAIVGVEERIPTPIPTIKKRADGSVYEIVDRDGRTLLVWKVLNEGETEWTILAAGNAAQRISVPLAEISQVKYKKTNVALTILAIAVPAALGLVVLGVLVYANNI